MLRFASYIVPVACLLAIKWLYRLVNPAVIVAFFGFPLACAVDFTLRARNGAPTVLRLLLRGAAFVAWLPFAMVGLLRLSQIRVPSWRQGPDTSYSRKELVTLFGERNAHSLKRVYYFKDPTFVGRGDEYIRFEFRNRAELESLLSSHSALEPTAVEECRKRPETARQWWLEPSRVTGAYRWQSHYALVCVDERQRRAFVYWPGH